MERLDKSARESRLTSLISRNDIARPIHRRPMVMVGFVIAVLATLAVLVAWTAFKPTASSPAHGAEPQHELSRPQAVK